MSNEQAHINLQASLAELTKIRTDFMREYFATYQHPDDIKKTKKSKNK